MNWKGKWKNEYGSVLEITDQGENVVRGSFTSAVDQTTKGKGLFVTGVYNGNLLSVVCQGGNHVVTYAGMFYDGKLETVWYVVADSVLTAEKEGQVAEKRKLAWWESVKSNADTFEKLE